MWSALIVGVYHRRYGVTEIELNGGEEEEVDENDLLLLLLLLEFISLNK